MAIGVTFPENEDVVTFWWKIERLVRVESKVDIYKKELGNYAGYRLRKVYWKDLHYWDIKISRDAVTHVTSNKSNWNNASKEGSECNESNACYMQVIQESQVMQVSLQLPLAHLWIHFRVKFYREIDIELYPEALLSFHSALIVRGKWKNGKNVSSSGKISAFSEW